MKNRAFHRTALAALCVAATGLPQAGVLAQSPAATHASGLVTPRQAASVAPNPIYGQRPLTVECYARMNSRATYNILLSYEPKSSCGHWELFTMPATGLLHSYVPGYQPDTLQTEWRMADGKWHHFALVLEEQRGRIFVDGVLAGEHVLARRSERREPGPLVMGALDNNVLDSDGELLWVRLSSGARDIRPLTAAVPAADAVTIGLWSFNQVRDKRVADLSSLRNEAVVHTTSSALKETGIWPGQMPGTMSAAFQPMPPTKDVSAERRALGQILAASGLKTVSSAEPRDGVLRYWLAEYDNWRSDVFAPGQLEYPLSRPQFGNSRTTVAGQAYDQHALIWPEDGGPLGTALRRTGALLDWLSKANPSLDFAAQARDYAALQAHVAAAKTKPGTPDDLAVYLAVCALRRHIALRNPLLDFDQLLCVARGCFEGSARSNPSTADVQGGHFATQFFGFNALPGGGLYAVRDFKTAPRFVNLVADSVVQNGRLKGRKLDHGAFATPDLSFDGRQIVFAWTANREHKWVFSESTVFHLFKVNVDGTGLTQLTDGDTDDFGPCWLPNGRIAFVSERRGGYIRCFAVLPVRNHTLFSMKSDGTDIVPLSYFETSEWSPSVNHAGQLVYTRWDYTDRENCLGTRFWISGPDGADPRSPHGNYPKPYHTFPGFEPWAGGGNDSRSGTPLVEMSLRAIPNSSRYVFTAAPHHGEWFGSIGLLDLGVADDGHMAQLKRFTPDEPFPETELPARRHYKYGTPWPLSVDFMLCNAWEDLVLLDRFGNKELLAEHALLPCAQDERLRIIQPIPLRARPAPPAMPPRAAPGSAARDRKPATVAVMNVYDSDLPFPPGTKIKWLRVTQNILKENHEIGQPMIGYERENTPRIPLGIVPVEADGSAYFEAPVAKELIFQALDEDHRAVQSMRAVAFVHPGEQMSCQGCHEPTQRSPQLAKPPLATQRAPSRLQPELGRLEPISYYRQVKPIFEKSCLPCHAREHKGPQDMSYAALRDDVFWFSGAMSGGMVSPYSGIHGGSRTIPGRFGANYCKLGNALASAAHLKAVSETDRRTVALWLDSNSLRLGAYEDEAAQLRGELVWPVLDVDPRNPLGTETTAPALTRNFWHENFRGPYACLISEHAHNRIALLDERGEVVWDYSVPHPQDVWMLPNGNILTTYYQGVREVTRAKEVVWEYRAEKPNEIPCCQPLPDGNVLIGIVGECRLIEVNRQGAIVHEVRLATTEKEPHAQFRMCRKTPAGTYLVPFTAEGAVREYDAAGKTVHEFPREPSPVAALRLPNGNTLISAGGAVTEYDTSDNVVWRVDGEWLPDIQIGVPAGLQRLPNGNTIVCNWNTHDEGDRVGAHIFELTPDKRIVWKVTGTQIGQVAQCQLLTPDFRLREEAIIR